MTTQRDEPAHPHYESREEVLERVARESPAIESPAAKDPSTRRGFTRYLLFALFGGAVLGYAVTFVVTGFAVGWGPAVQWGFAGALIVGVLAALLTATDEDGRIARRVGRREGPQPAPDETSSGR
jgi:hypothetical protein